MCYTYITWWQWHHGNCKDISKHRFTGDHLLVSYDATGSSGRTIMCSTMPSQTRCFVYVVTPRIDFFLSQFPAAFASFSYTFPPLTHWVKCHLEKDNSHYYHPWFTFLLTKVSLIFLLPSSWLRVNDHTQCTDNRDATTLVAVSCDPTEPFSHTTEIPQAFIYVDKFIWMIMETSPRRGRLAHKSDLRNIFSNSTSCIQDIVDSFLR